MRRTVSVGVVLAFLLVAGGCSKASLDDGTNETTGGFAATDEAADVAREPSGESDSDRQVITRGSVTLAVTDALSAADQAGAIAQGLGGRVDSRSERADDEDDPASAFLTLRIPADRVDDALEQLTALGDLRDLTLNRQDVTLTVTDLDARIQALQVSIARLETLMSTAGSVADLLAAENALTQRQSSLDSLTAQRSYLAEQVELATISVSLLPRELAPAPEPGGVWGGVVTGWNALVSTFNRAVEMVGVLVPWAALFGLVAAGVYLALRPRRRPATETDKPPGETPGG